MNEDAMNVNEPQATTEAQTLLGLTEGPLSCSISQLPGCSQCMPSEKDFHFHYNFSEFKNPIEEIAKKTQSMLETIGSSAHIWGNEMVFPVDIDDAYEWLVNVNDEVYHRLGVSVDEFQRIRKEEEGTGRQIGSVVAGKEGEPESSSASGVKMATKDEKTTMPKPKVPFNIPTLTKPQDEYRITVNNSNHPFEHVRLQRSEDGQRFIHPLEKHSFFDFVDKDLGAIEPIKPPSLECTPYMLVQEVKGLKELAAKLHAVNEFAVDLEHNHYRSFQGLTCLMQISTRTEDFVVDTFKLWDHVGPCLREIFRDPAKKKVMHGADRDIVWLQRDFGIYVCNLFDTGQASRVLKLERYSLQYLLHHFCGVVANKEYQSADWRIRPLPGEMLRYAREDTHYLLYIYDLMRTKLLELSKEAGSSYTPLVEVYNRSYDVCRQLYEKELLTENSYLSIYGLRGAGFNAQQVSIVSGLYEWRDEVARSEDEGTSYILPNKSILEIAKKMPVTINMLRRVIKSRNPYVDRNLDILVNIIRQSMRYAAPFEAAAQQLKEAYASAASSSTSKKSRYELIHHFVEMGFSEEMVIKAVIENGDNEEDILEALLTYSALDVIPDEDESEPSWSDDTPSLEDTNATEESVGVESSGNAIISGKLPFSIDLKEDFLKHLDKNGQVKPKSNITRSALPSESPTTLEQNRNANGSGTTGQGSKRPADAFGQQLGNECSKRKLDPDMASPSTSTSARYKLVQHFVEMGFCEEMVIKAVKENGDDEEGTLETLLTYSALEVEDGF